MCFWIGAAFQFGLFNLPDLGPVVNALMKSGITTGGFGTIAMILYLELTNPRRMRFESKLDIEVLPELNEFMARFAERRGWDESMKNRLSAVGEETLLTLDPLETLRGMGRWARSGGWWWWRRAMVRWQSWSLLAAGTTRRISRIGCGSCSSTIRMM